MFPAQRLALSFWTQFVYSTNGKGCTEIAGTLFGSFQLVCGHSLLHVPVVHTRWLHPPEDLLRHRPKNGSLMTQKACHLPRYPVSAAALKRNAPYYRSGSPATFSTERGTGEYRENWKLCFIRHYLGNEHGTPPDSESRYKRKLQKFTGNDIYATLAVLQRWLWEKNHLRTAEFWITVTVDIAVHITKNVNYLVLFVTRHAHNSSSPPDTAQPSVLLAIDVCLLMKWNYIAMGKKITGRTAIRVMCFPTYLICPRRSHGDILFPIDELYVIRNPPAPTLHT